MTHNRIKNSIVSATKEFLRANEEADANYIGWKNNEQPASTLYESAMKRRAYFLRLINKLYEKFIE